MEDAKNNNKTCPIHIDRELKEFTAGPNAKTPGMKYWKCTKMLGEENGKKTWCEYVQWPENDFSYTKKFTQTETGVKETVEPFAQPSLQDVMASLGRLHAKLNKLLNGTEND